MRPLTKEAETKLIAAIEKAAGYVNSGLAPNEAIIKSASEADIHAGHINLMVHAYNTGRTTKQREQSDDTLEKAADFPMADAQTVMDALYPKVVKTAADISRSSVVSVEYAVSPRDMLARRNSSQDKAAAAKISLPEKTWTPPPRDEEASARKAASDRRAAELAQEELRRRATVAYAKAAAAMDELHDYFRHPGNMNFQDAVRHTRFRLGEEGVAVLQKLAAVYPRLEKQAATSFAIVPPSDGRPFNLVSNVLDAVYDYNEAKAAVPVKTAKHKKEAPVFLTDSILYNAADEPLTLKSAAPQPPGSPAPPPPGAGASKPAAKPAPSGGGGKSDGFLAPALSAARRMATDPLGHNYAAAIGDSAQMKSKAMASLTDPEHETELRNIRAQGVLHDMMLNDPVISGHDPHDVALAFNELADVAPGFVDSPGAMQALLRKRLEAGQMADFDIKQLVDMEKARAETDKARTETMRFQRDLM